MTRAITQRELRNHSGEIMRALDRGEDFVVTRNGVAVGELRPVRRYSVDQEALAQALQGAAGIDRRAFRTGVDAILDQDVEPRA